MYHWDMAHFHIKTKNGRPYLYVREIARVQGKPKVVSQVYIGAPERVRDMVDREGPMGEAKLRVQEFGSVWMAERMDRGIDLAGIVDSVVKRDPRETGPSVGEYFLYAVINRMIDACSKRALPDWFGATAIQEVRPVDLAALSSDRFWDKWDRVGDDELRRIERAFFERIWGLRRHEPDCLVFDTTNYYTYMSSGTPSELAKRGKNKQGKHHLRQVGLALLVTRGERMPLFYRAYEGNLHDSREFAALMDEMFGFVCGLSGTKRRLTFVIDKGMNSEENFARIDEHGRIHFVTTYSPHFAPDLAAIPLERFSPVDGTARDGGEPVLAYRAKGEYWGRERTVIVTFNPRTATKQSIVFEEKLGELRAELLAMRAKVNAGAPQWRDRGEVEERYVRACRQLHLPVDIYDLTFDETADGLRMGFRQDAYRVGRKRETFGKSIVVTDNDDWSTEEIVATHFDRWQVESEFRQSKDDDLVAAFPLRHWTDDKIRCHLFSCVVALTYLRRLELEFAQAGLHLTADAAMKQMRTLHSVLALDGRMKKPRRRLEEPTKTQALILRSLGHVIDPKGVLQPVG